MCSVLSHKQLFDTINNNSIPNADNSNENVSNNSEDSKSSLFDDNINLIQKSENAVNSGSGSLFGNASEEKVQNTNESDSTKAEGLSLFGNKENTNEQKVESTNESKNESLFGTGEKKSNTEEKTENKLTTESSSLFGIKEETKVENKVEAKVENKVEAKVENKEEETEENKEEETEENKEEETEKEKDDIKTEEKIVKKPEEKKTTNADSSAAGLLSKAPSQRSSQEVAVAVVSVPNSSQEKNVPKKNRDGNQYEDKPNDPKINVKKDVNIDQSTQKINKPNVVVNKTKLRNENEIKSDKLDENCKKLNCKAGQHCKNGKCMDSNDSVKTALIEKKVRRVKSHHKRHRNHNKVNKKAKYCSTLESQGKQHTRKYRKMCGHVFQESVNKALKERASQGNGNDNSQSQRLQALEEKVGGLSDQLSQLLNSNKLLSNKMNSYQRKQELTANNDSDMLNFMQVKETKLKSIEKNINRNRHSFQKSLDNEQQEVNNLMNKNDNSIKTLQDKISTITENIDNLKQSLNEVSDKMTTKHAKSENLRSKSLRSHKMDIGIASVGSLSLDGEHFKINPNTNIYIGKSKISSEELMNNLKFMSFMKKKCGEDLSRCKIQNEAEYQAVLSDEKEILRKLRHLKRETEEY